MKSLSEAAELSKLYTNHCIRRSVVDTPDENEFKARHIMAHTGHKSESSIRQYTSKCPPKIRRKMAKCLAEQLEPPAKITKPTPSSTVSVNPDNVQNKTVSNNAIVATDSDNNDNNVPNLDQDWLEVDNNTITDNKLVDILTQIEIENAHLMPLKPIDNRTPTKQTNTINVANVSNVQ